MCVGALFHRLPGMWPPRDRGVARGGARGGATYVGMYINHIFNLLATVNCCGLPHGMQGGCMNQRKVMETVWYGICYDMSLSAAGRG